MVVHKEEHEATQPSSIEPDKGTILSISNSWKTFYSWTPQPSSSWGMISISSILKNKFYIFRTNSLVWLVLLEIYFVIVSFKIMTCICCPNSIPPFDESQRGEDLGSYE